MRSPTVPFPRRAAASFNKSLQATRDGASSSASRFTLVDPACLIWTLGGIDVCQINLNHWSHLLLMSSKKYKREWTAICPRCNKQLSYADYVCPNCGKGKIKANVYNVSGVKSVYLGCENCDETCIHLTCSCGANIQTSQLHVKGGGIKKGCAVILLIAFLFFVILPIIIYIIGKLLG
jgi:hypothetical protein